MPAECNIDLQVLEAAARMQCTIAEAASLVKCSSRTLLRRLQVEDSPERLAWDAGRNGGKASLRRRLWSGALKDTNAGVRLAMFLAMNYLGMSDRITAKNVDPDDPGFSLGGGALDPEALKNLSDDELARLYFEQIGAASVADD